MLVRRARRADLSAVTRGPTADHAASPVLPDICQHQSDTRSVLVMWAPAANCSQSVRPQKECCLSDMRARSALSRVTWSPVLSLLDRGDWHAIDHPVLLWRWPAVRQTLARTSR